MKLINSSPVSWWLDIAAIKTRVCSHRLIHQGRCMRLSDRTCIVPGPAQQGKDFTSLPNPLSGSRLVPECYATPQRYSLPLRASWYLGPCLLCGLTACYIAPEWSRAAQVPRILRLGAVERQQRRGINMAKCVRTPASGKLPVCPRRITHNPGVVSPARC